MAARTKGTAAAVITLASFVVAVSEFYLKRGAGGTQKGAIGHIRVLPPSGERTREITQMTL